ncbi:AI-2E family transporter [Zavarzinia sp. CC-PAN008]|uniref:AI-2E family transporter n=1 Tax=Zavarzinia sp. CC-PAN008 TaxID=3243332 RepID=UPI003F746B37
MTRAERWIAAVLGVVAAGFVIWSLGGVLTPFLIAMAVAYVFDPVADWLERRGVRRSLGAILVIIAFFVVVIAVFALFVPLVRDQAIELSKRLPGNLASLQGQVMPWLQQHLGVSAGDMPASGEMLQKAGEEGAALVGNLVAYVWSGGLFLVNLIAVLLVTPIVAFYLLRDWDHIVAEVNTWLPVEHAGTIRDLAGEVDVVLSGFLRGQGTVALTTGVLYATSYALIGLDFGIVIGLFTGLMVFVPYVGPLIGLSVAMLVGFGQFWPDYVPLLMVLGAHFTIQTLEGSFITPVVVGRSVGLHDAWIIFALLVGGTLFGFVGVLLAVPVAAAVGVVARHFVKHYMASDFYAGQQKGRLRPPVLAGTTDAGTPEPR